jgi:hypothetical protein
MNLLYESPLSRKPHLWHCEDIGAWKSRSEAAFFVVMPRNGQYEKTST